MALPLGWCRNSAASIDGILVGSSNEMAVRHIQNAGKWTTPVAVLIGPAGSGKSLLASMFAESGAGMAIDDLCGAEETTVFHAWNRTQSGTGRLLVTARSQDEIAAVRLADLRTRLSSAPTLVIGEPDLCLAAALIERLLAARGYAPTPQMAAYASERIVRTYSAIHALIDAIDARAAAEGRMLTVRLMRDAIRDLAAAIPTELAVVGEVGQ